MTLSRNPYKAYQHACDTKNHAEKIVMLYEAAISYMQQAVEADKNKKHEERFNLINKTIAILHGLQACLDFGANEEVAKALNNYYSALDDMLAAAQCQDERQPVCEQIIENLRIIKNTWEGINLVDTSSSDDEQNDLPDNIPPPFPEDYQPQDMRI